MVLAGISSVVITILDIKHLYFSPVAQLVYNTCGMLASYQCGSGNEPIGRPGWSQRPWRDFIMSKPPLQSEIPNRSPVQTRQEICLIGSSHEFHLPELSLLKLVTVKANINAVVSIIQRCRRYLVLLLPSKETQSHYIHALGWCNLFIDLPDIPWPSRLMRVSIEWPSSYVERSIILVENLQEIRK